MDDLLDTPRDFLVTWSTCIYSIRSESQVYGSFLEKFSTSHRDIIDDEHNFSSLDGRSIREDHPDVRGYAMGLLP